MDIRRDVPLASYTTFNIGGPADYFVIAESQEDIVEAVKLAKAKEMPFFLLGTGANILVGDKGYRGLVIKNEARSVILSEAKDLDSSPAERDQNDNKKILLTAESGATIAELIDYTKEKGLSGFEHFAGIPSSVGGALWQNLHFLSPDRSKTVFIGDMIESAEILQTSDSFQVREVSCDYFHFSYDYSVLHDNHDIVLSVTFALTPESPEVIQERIDANLKWRQEKHPANAIHTSAGSIFKKVKLASSEGGGYGAGRLIEQVGLKGKAIGGAKISEQHANFIINENGAYAADVRALIDLVQQTVKEKLGLTMQTEISFIGEF